MYKIFILLNLNRDNIDDNRQIFDKSFTVEKIWKDKYFTKQAEVRRAKNERRWIYKRNTRSGLHHKVRHNYNFGESRGRSQVADECSIVEKGSAWHNAAGWKTMEGTRWDQERGDEGARERKRARTIRRRKESPDDGS